MNFVTYKENETVDNDANYFLMEITNKVDISNFSELEIRIKNNLVMEDVKPEKENFPLFCFQNENVDKVEDLNLNSLKKFSHDCAQKYILFSLKDNDGKRHHYLKNKSFNDWNYSNAEVKLTFLVSSVDKYYCGKILKIFHKHYQPTITN